LNATANIAGNFTYTPSAGTVLAVGNHTLNVVFTPADSGNYTVASANVTVRVMQTTPALIWNTPPAIAYGTELGATQLNAMANIAGNLTYTPSAGTVLAVGNHTLNVVFTPADSGNYTTASGNVTVRVMQAAPALIWNTPPAIAYGTALGAFQLNAMANIAGNFTYTPSAGAVLPAGNHTLSVGFTPTDTGNYTTASGNVTVRVMQATPALIWNTPPAIAYGTELGATQLNAMANIAGNLTYTPAAGTVLAVGNHTLNVVFTPADSGSYTVASVSVPLQVNSLPAIDTPPPVSSPASAPSGGGVPHEKAKKGKGAKKSSASKSASAKSKSASGGSSKKSSAKKPKKK
jgi:hydroxypyruvate isomerase